MPKLKSDEVDLHVKIPRNQQRMLKVALRILGYKTLSELIRERCVRWAIAEAKLTAQDGRISAKETSG